VSASNTVNEASYEIAEGKGVNGSNALAISSNSTVYGVRYIFDKAVDLKEGQAIYLDVAFGEKNTLKAVTAEARSALSGWATTAPVKGEALTTKEYTTLAFSQRDIVDAGLLQVYELRLKIEATSANKNNVVYLDNVRIYDPSADKTAPVVTTKSANTFTYTGDEAFKTAKFDYLEYSVTDEDYFTTLSIVSVKAPDGSDVAFDDNGFVPTVSGAYKVNFQAKDSAGNLSQITEAVYNVTVYTEKEDLYDELLKFDSPLSKNLFGFIDASHVEQEVEAGNVIVRISNFGGFNGTTDRSKNGIRLNLGGVYTLGEIGEIKISVKQNVNGTPVTSGDVDYMNGTGWLNVWANREAYTDKLLADGATTVTNAQLNAIALRSFQASAISASEYQTISISASQIAAIYETTGFTADTPLDVLSMAYTDGNTTNRVANLIIDKIEIVTKAELATKINEELKFNSSENISLLWKQNGTVAIEDDGLGNSVAAISYSGYGGANTSNINSNTIRISMGSIFTLGQISEIKIRLKQNATAGTSTSMNSNIWINRNELAHDTTNANNSTINNGFVKQFNAGSLSATEYSTVTITYDNISAKYATNGLSDATVLNTIAFGFTASGGRLAYLHIDSIEIVLK
jgi:hypothetical protein